MDRFEVVSGDRYIYCPPAIDFVCVAMEGGHTWKRSIYMYTLYVLPWKVAVLERGPYTYTLCTCCHGRRPYLKGVHIHVHFWLEVVTLNPVKNQTGKRHFICVSMATNQDFHRTLVTCQFIAINCFFFSLFIPADHVFFFASEKKPKYFVYIIIFFFCLMPSFTKAKTFAKCPSVWDLLFFIFAFSLKNLCIHFLLTL